VRVGDGQDRPIESASVETFEDSRPGSACTDPEGRCVLDVAPGGGSMHDERDDDAQHQGKTQQFRVNSGT
jgi:hypothetical protein